MPDLTTLGKIIGGGLPVGASGGPRELMTQVSSTGPVYQAGTMSGNPLAMAAGLATLRAITADSAFYSRLEALGAALESGLREAMARTECRATLRVSRRCGRCFSPGNPFATGPTSHANTGRFASFFHEMLARDMLLAPSQFEANFISAAHTLADIDATVAAAADAVKAVEDPP